MLTYHKTIRITAMADRIHITFWNYNRFEDYKPQMLRDWVECGMTTPNAPMFDMNSSSELHEKFLQMLNDAQELGVQLIIQVGQLFLGNYYKGEETYRRQINEFNEKYGNHPSIYGIYVGEEPGSNHAEYFQGVRILREMMPHLRVYTNMGSIERTERMTLHGDETITDWCRDFVNTSGTDIIGFGDYAALLQDDSGMYEHFHNLGVFTDAGKAAGADIWATMLSSAHEYYRIPTEDDYRWQLNTCVACGCKGIVWFRLYDKLVAGDYRGSPIDEFGLKTIHYYDLARVQKKFNIHYGKIFAHLDHQVSYGFGVSYGNYKYFVPGCNDLVSNVTGRLGMISFFKGDDGYDYVVLLNTDQHKSGHIGISFSENVEKVETVYFNGERLDTKCVRNGKSGDMNCGTECFAPGQISLMKVTRVQK